MNNRKEIETLATFVHGSLSALHLLGAVYNVKRRNWKDAIIHSGVLIYDIAATISHAKAIDKPQPKQSDR